MKHKHAELIKQWADGAEIEVMYADGVWRKAENPIPWKDEYQYRIKPAAPKWPETTMTDAEIAAAAFAGKLCNQWRGIANAAIAHACETGQLVLPDPERDMKIAQAVKDAVINKYFKPHSVICSINLESIIKEATK